MSGFIGVVKMSNSDDEGKRFFKRKFIKGMVHPICGRWMDGSTLGRYLHPLGSIYEWCGHNCPKYPCDLVRAEWLKDDLEYEKMSVESDS